MLSNKSFGENLQFLTIENPWKDADSPFPQHHLVGVFPLHKIPSIEKKKSLENYGIPAGIFHSTGKSRVVSGGGCPKIKQKPTQVIEDSLFDSLFHLVSTSPSAKNNKTKKIHIKK